MGLENSFLAAFTEFQATNSSQGGSTGKDPKPDDDVPPPPPGGAKGKEK